MFCATTKINPDGFLPSRPEDRGPVHDAAVKAGWLDDNPLRVRNWLDYAGQGLRNRCRDGKQKEWYEETIKKWKALGWGPQKISCPASKRRHGAGPVRAVSDDGDARPAVARVQIAPVATTLGPTKPQRKQPEQLRLDGGKDKPDAKKLSGQQKIIEKFAQVKKMDWSTKEARGMVAKANAAAAASIDKLSEGDEEMALAFVEIATLAKEDEMTEWTKRDGQEHAFRQLAAILPMWSEFKTAWQNMKQKQPEAKGEHPEAAVPKT